jgi:hypothetical protein
MPKGMKYRSLKENNSRLSQDKRMKYIPLKESNTANFLMVNKNGVSPQQGAVDIKCTRQVSKTGWTKKTLLECQVW